MSGDHQVCLLEREVASLKREVAGATRLAEGERQQVAVGAAGHS